MKKFFIILLGICISFFIFSSSAFAEDINIMPSNMQNEEKFGISTKTEKDIVVDLLESTTKDLELQGYNEEQIEEIMNLEELFLELSTQSVDSLQKKGLSTKDIEILKQYQGEPITKDSDILNILASREVTTWFERHTWGVRQIGVRCHWEWNYEPLVVGKDTVVVSWKALDESLGVPDADASSSAYLDYANRTTNEIVKTTIKSASINGIDNMASVSFNIIPETGYFVKSGYLKVVLNTNNFTFNSALFGGCYGHSIRSFSGSYTYTVSSDLSITVFPTDKVSTTRAGQVRLFADGTMREL